MIKLDFARVNEDLSYLGIEIQGMRGTLATESSEALDDGHWQDEFLYAKAYTISGGATRSCRTCSASAPSACPASLS